MKVDYRESPIADESYFVMITDKEAIQDAIENVNENSPQGMRAKKLAIELLEKDGEIEESLYVTLRFFRKE